MSNRQTTKGLRLLKIISLLIFTGACILIVYDATIGHFLFGKSYGPGAYYYTDVPGWKHIFMDSPHLGFTHPVLAGIFFIAWALFMYKALCWLNDKL